MFKLNTKQAFYGQSTKGCFNVCRLPMILEVWLPTPTLVRKKVRWGHKLIRFVTRIKTVYIIFMQAFNVYE